MDFLRAPLLTLENTAFLEIGTSPSSVSKKVGGGFFIPIA